MPGITLNNVFTNPNLPSADSLGQQIMADASFLGWFQGDESLVDLSAAEILKFLDRAGGAGELVQYSATRRAVLTPGAIASFSAAEFSEVDGADTYSVSGLALPADSEYTYVVIFKPTASLSPANLFGRFSNATDRSILNIPGGQSIINFQHGTTPNLTHPLTFGEWSIVVAGFDGVNAQLYGDGVTYSAVPVLGTTGAGSLLAGSLDLVGSHPYNGGISDIILFNKSLFSNVPLLEIVKDYARLVYGLQT